MNVAEKQPDRTLFFFKTKHFAAAWNYQVCWSELWINCPAYLVFSYLK